MKVAALYDIHGNLPALEAVLDDVRAASVDRVVIGGDVFPGPMATEALVCLQSLALPTQFIRGNGDREVAALAAGKDPASIPEQYRATVVWAAEKLQPKHREAIASWPESVRLDSPGLGTVLFCHATPRNDTEIFTRLTPEQRLLAVFESTEASLVVCGHTHMQFDRAIGGIRVVNAGSVGMPFGGDPGAYWLLLGPDIELRRTSYDLEEAAARIRATDYPGADELAENNVLRTPSEEEILELFAKAELR